MINHVKMKFKELNSMNLLFDYQSYNLDRMNPKFYDIEDDKMRSFESMMHHKQLHDNCLLIMISKELKDCHVYNFLNEMIHHFEILEEYENCSTLKKIQSHYEN